MLRRLGFNFFAQMTSLLLAFADRFIVVGLLIKAWGADLYANWAILVSTAALIGLGELGLNVYYGNVWQRANATGDAHQFQRMLNVSLAIGLMLGAILVIVLLALATAIDVKSALSLSQLSPEDSTVIVLLLGFAAALLVVRGSMTQLYRGRNVYAVGSLVNLAPAAAAMVCGAFAAFSGASPLQLAVLYLLCEILAGWGFMLFDLKRRFPDLSFKPSLPSSAELSDLFHHVRWLIVPQIGPLAWLQLPVLMLGFFNVVGKDVIAFLLARTLVNFARQISMMVSRSLGVELVPSVHGGHGQHVQKWLAGASNGLSASAAALGSAIVVFGGPLFTLWTGDAGLFNAAVVMILVSGMVLATPTMTVSTVLLLTNGARPVALSMLAQLVVTIAGTAALLPHWGVAGAAVAIAVSDLAAAVALLALAARNHLDVDYWSFFSRGLLTIVVSAAVSGAAAFVLRGLIPGASLADNALLWALWGIFGFVPALLAGLVREQRRHLTSAFGSAWSALRARI